MDKLNTNYSGPLRGKQNSRLISTLKLTSKITILSHKLFFLSFKLDVSEQEIKRHDLLIQDTKYMILCHLSNTLTNTTDTEMRRIIKNTLSHT